MELRQYLDSTYLKTAAQAGLSELDNTALVRQFVEEAIVERFKLIMIRPEHVAMARGLVQTAQSNVAVGTVIDFPLGKNSIREKVTEATEAIQNGVDELDFVINYEAFKRGEIEALKEEILTCVQLGLAHHKVVKLIIEVAALSDDQIIQISSLIKHVVVTHCKESDFKNVFVKSSTGFFATVDGKPNGATPATICLMLENAFPLPVKAAGGVRTLEEAREMIQLGVKRIGTSAAKTIVYGQVSNSSY